MRLITFLDVDNKFIRVNPDQVLFLAPAPPPASAKTDTMLCFPGGVAFSVRGDLASVAAKFTTEEVKTPPLGKIAEDIVAALSEGWGEKEDAKAAEEIVKVLKAHFNGQ